MHIIKRFSPSSSRRRSFLRSVIAAKFKRARSQRRHQIHVGVKSWRLRTNISLFLRNDTSYAMVLLSLLFVCLYVCNVGVLCPNWWMDQNATWYGGRLGPGDIVLDRDPAPPQKEAQQPPHFSAHVYFVQTVAHLSNC